MKAMVWVDVSALRLGIGKGHVWGFVLDQMLVELELAQEKALLRVMGLVHEWDVQMVAWLVLEWELMSVYEWEWKWVKRLVLARAEPMEHESVLMLVLLWVPWLDSETVWVMLLELWLDGLLGMVLDKKMELVMVTRLDQKMGMV